MKRHTRRVASALAVTVAAGILTAIPAQAASLFLYADSWYGDQIGEFWSKMSKPHNISTQNNETLSSFKNKTSMDTAFYHNKNGGGHCFTGAAKTDAAFFWGSDDDKVSSFYLGKAC